MFSLPGGEDPIRKKMYRSIHGRPTDADRLQGASSSMKPSTRSTTAANLFRRRWSSRRRRR